MCFNQEAFDLHHHELAADGHIVCDAESVRVTPEFESRSSEAPLAQLATDAGGARRGKNLVAVGVVCGLLGLDTSQIEEFILKRYAHKGDVGEANIKALRSGVEFARDDLPDGGHKLNPPTALDDDRVLLSGNQAICIGALQAGLTYYAGYPITPASDILEWLSGRLPRFGGVAIQTEDEIAALASVLGASYAGKKAMTATSGPGISLMAELIGLAGMAEIPAVIVDSQRSGPSTGMPTKTEQSDLNHALYGGHGEAPRIVMAPTTVEDCFAVIVEAFNAAEQCQAPAIVLTDQSLSHRMETVPRPDLDALEVVDRLRPNGADAPYNRYAITDDGVSPMAIPGGPGAYVSTGIEHDEAGHPHYEPELHVADDGSALPQARAAGARRAHHASTGPPRPTSASSAGDRPRARRSRRPRSASTAGSRSPPATRACWRRCRSSGSASGRRAWAAIIVPELNVTGQFARLVRCRRRDRGRLAAQGDRPAVHGRADRRLHHRWHAADRRQRRLATGHHRGGKSWLRQST